MRRESDLTTVKKAKFSNDIGGVSGGLEGDDESINCCSIYQVTV